MSLEEDLKVACVSGPVDYGTWRAHMEPDQTVHAHVSPLGSSKIADYQVIGDELHPESGKAEPVP